jgi:membrane protein
MVEAVRGIWAALLGRLGLIWARIGCAFPMVGRTGAFIWEVLRKYHHDDCLTYAASISFFLTISLIPLATLFFKLLGLMLGSGAYSAELQRAISEVYPYLPQGFIMDTIQHSRRIGGIGSSWVVLFIGAHWGVNQLDRSLSHIFGLRIKVYRQTRKYNIFRRFAVVLGGLVFLVLLLAVGFEWTLRLKMPLALLAMYTGLPAVLGLLLVTTILQHLPRRHVLFRHALLGGLVCTSLWWVAKVIFGWYLHHTPTWGVLYGSLGSVMASLVFLYYSCAIFMLGAEVTAAFYRHNSTTGAMPIRKWS